VHLNEKNLPLDAQRGRAMATEKTGRGHPQIQQRRPPPGRLCALAGKAKKSRETRICLWFHEKEILNHKTDTKEGRPMTGAGPPRTSLGHG